MPSLLAQDLTVPTKVPLVDQIPTERSASNTPSLDTAQGGHLDGRDNNELPANGLSELKPMNWMPPMKLTIPFAAAAGAAIASSATPIRKIRIQIPP